MITKDYSLDTQINSPFGMVRNTETKVRRKCMLTLVKKLKYVLTYIPDIFLDDCMHNNPSH